MKGFVDYIDASHVKGWCTTEVEVVVDRRFVLDPDRVFERPDLQEAGLAGRGWECNLATTLPGYVPAEIVARPRGHVLPLPGGYLRLGPLRPFQYVSSDAAARAHNNRLLAGAVRGVCLFTSRSGGTYLTDLICSHPRAYGFAEPIEGFVRGGKAAFSAWMEDFFLLPSMIEYPREVTDPALMFMSTKIHRHDTDLFPMFNRYGVKYLRLYRENILKQAISNQVAHRLYAENHNFNLTQNEDSTRKRRRITIDPYILIGLIERYQELEKIIDDMVSSYAEGEVMSISYEQLVTDSNSISKIFEYFQLEPHAATSRHIKINSNDLSNVLDNYDEVKRIISKTRFAHYLN